MIIDWGALWDVVWISALIGIGVPLVLGGGIVAALRSSEPGANVAALRALTAAAVLIVTTALAAGLYFIVNK